MKSGKEISPQNKATERLATLEDERPTKDKPIAFIFEEKGSRA